MLAIEEKIFASGLPVASLMEKVGLGMTSWFKKNKYLLEEGVCLLIGPGHNGGDGLVVARELFLSGIDVKIWCPFEIRKELTSQLFRHVSWLGIQQLLSPPDPKDPSLWIDALFGLAQSRPLPSFLSELFQTRNLYQSGRLVSLDIPSGLNPDSGVPFLGSAAIASTTLTVGLYKRGLIQDSALGFVGNLVRIDIGINQSLLKDFCSKQPLQIISKDLPSIPFPNPSQNSMKYERGRTLIISGSNHFKGAANLTIQGALSSGVGSIKAALPREIGDLLWQLAPEVVFVSPLESSKKGGAKIGHFLKDFDLSRVDSILFGPGLGSLGDQWNLVDEPLSTFSGLLVIDADGLNRLAGSLLGWSWLKRRNGPTWITPHQAEFRNLFPEIKTEKPLDAALEASRLSGAAVLLKGAHSVIAEKNGSLWQLVNSVPFVARSGLGDLLAGYLAGVGALAISSGDFSEGKTLAIGAFIHAEASRVCAQGSSALSINSSLGELTRACQERKCVEVHNNQAI